LGQALGYQARQAGLVSGGFVAVNDIPAGYAVYDGMDFAKELG